MSQSQSDTKGYWNRGTVIVKGGGTVQHFDSERWWNSGTVIVKGGVEQCNTLIVKGGGTVEQ